MKILLRLIALSICVLSGCGGGGGGGGGGSSELSIGPLTPASINATLPDVFYNVPLDYSISAPFSGTPSSNVYVVVEDPDRVFTAGYASVSGSTATIGLRFNLNLAAGRYTRPLVLHACKDSACTQEYAGSPQTVRKDFLIESVSASPSRLDFSAPIGIGAVAQALTVTPPTGKDFSFDWGGYADYTSPSGSTSLVNSDRLFTVTRTSTGFNVQPKGAAPGRYRWLMAVNSPGYNSKTVEVVYEVAGTSPGAWTLLNPSIQATTAGATGSRIFADLDVIQNMDISEVRVVITGTPDPVNLGWLLYYDTVPFTHGAGPVDNARHVRFVLDRCGYGSSGPCLAAGVYTATIDLTVTGYGQPWRYTIPVTFTVN